MSADIDVLRARSDALEPGAWGAAVVVYEAILRLLEGDLLATRGLALALVKLGELDRAAEILQEALVRHPEDKILCARADDVVAARRWEAKEVPESAGKRRGSVTRVASTWIKAVHSDGSDWDVEPGEEMWLSDPGQRDAQGKRAYTGSGDPWGRPSWRIGEQAGVYFGGTQRVPVLVEVISLPDFNPTLVQNADWAEGDDGERWPWVTWVRVLKVVDVNRAPTLGQLGIPTASMQQRSRLRTDPEIHARLVQELETAS